MLLNPDPKLRTNALPEGAVQLKISTLEACRCSGIHQEFRSNITLSRLALACIDCCSLRQSCTRDTTKMTGLSVKLHLLSGAFWSSRQVLRGLPSDWTLRGIDDVRASLRDMR